MDDNIRHNFSYPACADAVKQGGKNGIHNNITYIDTVSSTLPREIRMTKLHETKGPALLLAGPGTGKTYTLGLRLKYLIEELDVDPDHITVITFTSEAAKSIFMKNINN